MKCPNCGQENIFGALACTACGSKMTEPCPRCGHENVIGVWACQNCGAFMRTPSRPGSTLPEDKP